MKYLHNLCVSIDQLANTLLAGYPDETLSTKERIEKMHNDAYIVMQNMVGIKEGDPTFNTDQNISNYTMHKNLNPKPLSDKLNAVNF